MPRMRGRANRSTVCALGVLVLALGTQASRTLAIAQQSSPARVVIPFDAGWRFSRSDAGSYAMPAFDDGKWRVVDVPHDWSAEGPFTAEYGSGNGWAPGGIGWYRKHFTLGAQLAGKLVSIEFDGVYDHAQIWVNGQLVCGRPYGYSSFECPLTPHVRVGASDNVVAVRVDHSRFADSRWYTGSGIYRHVRLCVTDPVRIAHWGTFVTTPKVTAQSATVDVETSIDNAADTSRAVTLDTEILLGADVLARTSTPLPVAAGERRAVVQHLTIDRPRRWTLDAPALYAVRQRLRAEAVVLDEAETTFGVRTIRFDPQRGFLLNDEPVKLKGVCIHHDAGSLGAAVPAAVWETRLKTLKSLGVNAIRTSHNPPAPELLDLADALGLLVKDEAFDEFTPTKNKWQSGWNVGVPSRFGYGESFTEWSVADASDMVRRDRNHPSVIAWSIGNEIDYPNDPFSHPILDRSYRPQNPPAANLVTLGRPLVDAIRKLDPTRPITAALASLPMSDAVGLPALLDIVGYNYQEPRYAEDHARYPSRVIFGSENNHQYANWTVVRDNPYVAGQFLWTGIDYLGEAGAFPNRANGAGLLDLTGFKKPMAWFRQSLWSAAPMVYLAASAAPAAAAGGGAPNRRPARLEEHWNWPAGSTVTVTAYSNTEDVTLTLNGQPIGTRPMTGAVDGALRWELPYQPGVLTAVARTKGTRVAEFTLTTAGPAAKIELTPEAAHLAVDVADVWQIEYRVVDAKGTRVPDANADITFELTGPARVLGIGNGDLNDPTAGPAPTHRAYQGRGLAIVQSTGASGAVTLRATAPGLQSATITLSAGGRPR
jgi:beta-galactosidase